MYLTIIMPCLNEEDSIEYCIKKAKRYLNKKTFDSEIIIVDNNSSDNSRKIAETLNVRVVIEKKKGYGAAVRRGIKEAKGEYFIVGDCDGSYDFENLDKFILKFKEGYDFVCGNRFKGGIKKGAMPLSHKFGAPFLSFIGRIKSKVPIKDFHCGLRGGKTSIAKSMNYKCNDFSFTAEQIMLYKGYKICEVPTILYRDKRHRKPHLRTIRDGIKYLIFILKCPL